MFIPSLKQTAGALSIAALISLSCLSVYADATPSPAKAVTTLKGKVSLPKQIGEGINTEGK